MIIFLVDPGIHAMCLEMVRLAKAMLIEKYSTFLFALHTFLFALQCILNCVEGVVLFGSLKGINDGEEEEDPVVEVVELLLVLELELELVLELGSLNGMRELLVTVELTVELLELDKVGVTVEVIAFELLSSPVCFLKWLLWGEHN